MNASKITAIKPIFFSTRDVSSAFKITEASARVLCHRYLKQKIFLRLKRGLYLLEENWRHIDEAQLYRLANRLQVPSYLSLMTALSHYQITTQVQRRFFESIGVVRTKNISLRDAQFRYTKLSPGLYFGFVKKDDYFIATPEKALLDAVYLASLGRYRLDMDSLNLERFDKKALKRLSVRFPAKCRLILETRCRI